MNNTMVIDGKEVVLVDKTLFQQLIHEAAAKMRENKRKGLCTMKDACDLLGVHHNTFYKMLKDPNCKIKKSRLHGKYVIESIEQEIARRERN